MNLVQKNNEIMPTVSALVDRAIHNHASQVALVYGNDTLTYQELGDQADQLRALLGTDHSDERIIAVSSTRSLAMVTGVLGILKAGKQYLPLDPTQPAERLRMIVEEAGVTNVLCPSEDEVALFQQIGLSPIMGGSDASPQPAARPHQQREGYVLYTSGSTGKPKGVNMGNDALVNLLQWQRIHSKAAEGSKTLQFAPLTFDVSFQEIFSTLITGGTLMLVDDDLRLNPLALLTHIEKNGINRLFLPYVALQMLADAADFSDVYPACIQEVVTAGEQLKITRQITRFF